MRQTLGETWLDPEELAYNVALDKSPRKGKVRCPDGRLRTVRLGVPDTFYTVPARVCMNGTTRHGFVSAQDTRDGSGGREFAFTLSAKQK